MREREKEEIIYVVCTTGNNDGTAVRERSAKNVINCCVIEKKYVIFPLG